MSLPETTDAPFSREEFTSLEVFDREQKGLFARHWTYGCQVSELVEVGQWRRIPVGGDELIVMRDGERKLHAFHNVCLHRGSTLVQVDAGQCRRLVCPYHAWTYGLDGALLAGSRMPRDFDVTGMRLAPASLEVWNGFVFVCPSPDAPRPVAEQLRAIDLSDFDLPHTKVVWRADRIVEANWKAVWENALECYHCQLNHRELCRVAAVNDPGAPFVDTHGRGFEWFPDDPLLEGAQSLTTDGCYGSKRFIRHEPRQTVSLFQWHQAGFDVTLLDDHFAVIDIRPLSPSQTLVRQVGLVHSEAVEGVDYAPQALFELHFVTRNQDDEICARLQRGVSSSAFRSGPYHPEFEQRNRNFVRFYRQAMSQG